MGKTLLYGSLSAGLFIPRPAKAGFLMGGINSMPRKYNLSLTYRRANEELKYSPVTGCIARRSTGKPAETNHSSGYSTVNIGTCRLYAHRVAWLLAYKKFPPDGIDHINGDKKDNTLSNLRAVAMQQNMKNKGIYKNSPTGVNNVRWVKEKKKFRAKITVNKDCKHLGYFNDFFEACCARKAAENYYGFHENHGHRQAA